MKPIRVLVVDDASVFRTALKMGLGRDPDIEVVGTAANGRIALDCVKRLHPDVVTLDFEMPEMNGLEVLRIIKKDDPKIKVIMASAFTSKGAELTMEALTSGATDFVAKPSGGSVREGLDQLVSDLLPKIKGFFGSALSGATQRLLTRSSGKNKYPASLYRLPEVVCIGISTGGPQSLADVIPKLSRNFLAPIAIVQHMPPIFTAKLADRLNNLSELNVVEAAQGDVMKAGSVYVAPGGKHMRLRRGAAGPICLLDEREKLNSCRPAVDALFSSAAEAYSNRVLACVMTGMGQDGLIGAQNIVAKGGSVFCQDRDSCVVWGMPRAIQKAGIAEAVIPLDKIGQALNEFVMGKK